MRLGAYTRVSRVGDRGDSLLSPRLQAEQIAAWAAGRHEVVPLDPELDESGGREDRPVLQGALGAVERGELDGLVVAKFDRLSRSLSGSLRILERVEAAGGRIYSVAEQLDGATVEGRMTRNILISVAQAEREHKAEVFDRVRADAVARGIHIAGKVPFGYRRGPGKVLVPDRNAPIVRGMFEARAAGASWRKVGGERFAPQAAARMIANRVYLGEARNGEHRNPTAHEALVDRATFEAAQIPHPRPPRGSIGPALLSGLIYCAGCGRALVPTTRSGVRAYRCRRATGCRGCHVGEWIEGYVSETIGALMRDHAFASVAAGPGLREAEDALLGAEAELAAYQQAVAAAEVGPEVVADALRTRAEAVSAARRALAVARTTTTATHDWASAWGSLDVTQRRHALRASGLSVIVRRGRGRDPDRVRIVGGEGMPADLVVA